MEIDIFVHNGDFSLIVEDSEYEFNKVIIVTAGDMAEVFIQQPYGDVWALPEPDIFESPQNPRIDSNAVSKLNITMGCKLPIHLGYELKERQQAAWKAADTLTHRLRTEIEGMDSNGLDALLQAVKEKHMRYRMFGTLMSHLHGCSEVPLFLDSKWFETFSGGRIKPHMALQTHAKGFMEIAIEAFGGKSQLRSGLKRNRNKENEYVIATYEPRPYRAAALLFVTDEDGPRIVVRGEMNMNIIGIAMRVNKALEASGHPLYTWN